MFKNLRASETENLNHSGRSLVGETLQLEGDLRSSGSVDVAGLINGNVFVSDMIVTDTGSVRGSVEAVSIEVNGHVEGKITADTVIVGKSAVIKGDIFFKNSLKTEEGADIEGYIKACPQFLEMGIEHVNSRATIFLNAMIFLNPMIFLNVTAF